MHFHHYALRQLSQHLTQQYQGEPVVECFSQSRNELILVWPEGYLRIGCNTPNTYVVPVQEFAKARKNVVDLFEGIYGLTLQRAYTVENEREMVLELSEDHQLILKMHGTMANVLLRHGGEIVAMFDHRHEDDWEYEEVPGEANHEALEQEVPASKRQIQEALRQVSLIYDKQFARRILVLMQGGANFKAAFEQVVTEAQNEQFFIHQEKRKVRFWLFPPDSEEDVLPVKGIAEGLSLWLKCHFQYTHYQQSYKQVQRHAKQPYDKYQKVYQSYLENIEQLETQRNPEEIGHLIMANLHQIPPEVEKAELEDLYQGGTLEVKLDPQRSPQDNAKRYYDKHKQRRQKLSYLQEQLGDIEEKLLDAEEKWEQFQQLTEPEDLPLGPNGFDLEPIKALKQVAKAVIKEQKAQEEERYPFRHFRREGYEIFVGRSARNNDELSFKFAHKNDLWLHAKDVTGSHVIIRQRPGKELPLTVLEYAAQLAAYYSKRKNDTLVPVQYTPRKYIRKRKGDPPGLVAVDREDVIMVEPVRE